MLNYLLSNWTGNGPTIKSLPSRTLHSKKPKFNIVIFGIESVHGLQSSVLLTVSARLQSQMEKFIYILWANFIAFYGYAHAVDAPSPEEWHARQIASSEEWSWWPWKRVEQLEAARNQLLQQISVLPQHQPIFQSNRLGFHSSFAVPGPEEILPPHQIEFELGHANFLDSIALVPAFNPKRHASYAFPKRFKIEALSSHTRQFETIANWMDEDFPDPGLYPVFFNRTDLSKHIKKVRITVPQNPYQSDAAYYALGEVYILQQRPNGSIAANMAEWGSDNIYVKTSDSFSMPPLWDISYLNDGVMCLGFPLSDKIVESEDLLITYDADEAPTEGVQVMLDLGQTRPIGRIDFWPAKAPHFLALPSFGFPREISVELSMDPNFETVKVVRPQYTEANQPRTNLLSVVAGAAPARYIRITMKGFSEHQGKRIFGLGEILVTEFDQAFSIGCKVTARGIPDADLDQLPRLVDGCSWQRRILQQGEWIKGLAERRPLDKRLAFVNQELEWAQVNWLRIQRQSTIWIGSIIVICLLGGLLVQKQMRRRSINKLKWRIARDLHDDVGSNLGSISFAADELELANTDANEATATISLLAREACAALREVVWVIDKSTIRLPQLIQQLVERAERVLDRVALSVQVPTDCPDQVVSLIFKRHLFSFFKEAVHNCARHSQATQVEVIIAIVDQCLQISLRDNGCGYDQAAGSSGWGLASMKDRAKEMDGELEVLSRLGEGTTVRLTVSLKSLLSETDNLYKTSN